MQKGFYRYIYMKTKLLLLIHYHSHLLYKEIAAEETDIAEMDIWPDTINERFSDFNM